MKKIIIPLLFIVLLLAMGAFFFYKEKTNGWKIYTDSSFGYSIKYPTDWQIDHPSPSGKTNPDSLKGRTNISNAGPKRSELLADLTIHPNNPDDAIEPLTDWVKGDKERFKKWCGAGCSGAPLEFVKETTIDGRKAVKASRQTLFGIANNGSAKASLELIYYIDDAGSIYTISLNREDATSNNFDEANDKFGRIFQSMLSSFKFKK